MTTPEPRMERLHRTRVRMIRVQLLHELDCMRLFLAAARLHIQGGDDIGMLHSIAKSVRYFEWAAESVTDLWRVQAEINDGKYMNSTLNITANT